MMETDAVIPPLWAPFDGLELRIQGLPRVNPSARAHRWTLIREKQDWVGRAWIAVRAAQGPFRAASTPLPRALVTYTRHSSVRPDQTNLAYSFKNLEDGLVRAGCFVDDSPEYVTNTYRWEKAPPRAGFVTVTMRLDPDFHEE